MRLTVKTSSTKLREATRTSSSGGARDPFAGGEIIEGKRNRIVKKSYIIPNESDVDSDESMEDPADEDAEEEDDEEADMDAEDEEMGDDDPDGDGDIDMEVDVPSLPPVIKAPKASGKGKNIVVVKPPAPKSKVAPVEQKEAEDASDDEELSELDSDLGEEVEEEEGMQTGNEEDAEGEDEEIDVEEGEEEEEDSLLSDEGTPGMGSRASSPDLNKLTKRQRARFEESDGGHLMALPDGKCPLTHPPYISSYTSALPEIRLTRPLQKCKSRNTSRRKSTPCAARRWRAAARTSRRSATRRRRWKPSINCSRSRRPRPTRAAT